VIRESLAICMFTALTACGGGDVCVAGQAGCPCGPGNVCESTPEQPLACEQGWCVSRDCVRGSEGCGCYANGTCDPLDGVPMTCERGTCRRTAEPAAGTLNGRCDVSTPCESTDQRELECVAGRCQLAGCPSGALGCPCGPYGACSAYGDQQPTCADGICGLAGCAPGSDGCACREGACDEGTCRRGVCVAEPGAGVVVEGDVRACELVVELGDVASFEVAFDEGVLGHHRRRGEQLALAFTTRRDQPFERAPARIAATRREGGLRGHDAELRVLRAECFDRLGHRDDGARVRLEVSP
jgi:hypothetical protein